jgi:hypothetical protein
MLLVNIETSGNAAVCVQGYPSGFPVLMPNRLSQQRSTAVLQYLMDSNYLDKNTRQLTAEAMTYNAELAVLGYTRATFNWHADGTIKGTSTAAARFCCIHISKTSVVYPSRADLPSFGFGSSTSPESSTMW